MLRDEDYRRLWISGFCISAARWMDIVTLGWLALQLTGSPFMVGLAAFARSAPLMLVGPFGGVLADRMPRGQVLVATQAAGLLTSLALVAIFATGHGGYGPLVALEVVFGALWAIDFPARRTALYTLLGAARVAQAVSLETVSMQIAKILGPVAVGLCLARGDAPAAFALIAAVYGAAVAASLGLRHRLGGPGTAAGSSVLAGLRTGLTVAWRQPTVRGVLLATIAMNVLFFPYQHMLPVFAHDVLAVGPAVLGAMFAADGCGALAGAIAIAARGSQIPHARLFAAAVLSGPFLLAAFSGSRWLGLCIVLLVIMGVAESSFAAMQSTVVLLNAPEHARGGAMGILSACIGTQPLGTLFIGFVAGTIGVSLAFTVNAVLAFVAIVPLAIPLARRASRS